MADHFLELSPDEIFELAERAGRDEPVARGASPSALLESEDGVSEYRALVARVTEVLTQQVELPTFDQWVELYRDNPELIESRLLGFWRDHAG